MTAGRALSAEAISIGTILLLASASQLRRSSGEQVERRQVTRTDHCEVPVVKGSYVDGPEPFRDDYHRGIRRPSGRFPYFSTRSADLDRSSSVNDTTSIGPPTVSRRNAASA
jgi:hypothetical protein